MTISTFVGREPELNRLIKILELAGKGNGRIIFIEGEAGSGKSFLLQGLQKRLDEQKINAGKRFVYGYCYEDSGSQNAYQPFVEILGTLIAKDNSKDSFTKLFLSILKETGGDWLAMIPGVGPAITAGLKTATIIAGQWLPQEESKPGGQSSSLSNQYVQAITKITEKFSPLVLIIEDAHWIDESSCLLLQRIEKKIGDIPLMVVITYRPSFLGEGHPFWKSRNEILSRSRAEVISLGGLSNADVDEYILRRFGNQPHPRLAEWLAYLCKGNPLFLTQYLSLLEQDNILKVVDNQYVLSGGLKYLSGRWELSGDISHTDVPNSIEALLEQRIKRLVEEDQEMLQLGAVQGDLFMSSILADLLDRKESDILRRLRKVMEQHRLISLYTGTDLDKTRTEIYTFEHALLQQTLYNKLSPRERVLYHRETAEHLVKTIGEDKSPARKLIIDTANHFDLGQIPERAAEYYYLASQSLLANNARTEAAEIAKRGLRNVNQVPGAYALKAGIIAQLLSAIHNRIHGQSDLGELQYLSLINEAIDAADQTEDRQLMAQVKYLEALYQVSLGSLTQAIVAYEQALNLIKQAQDPIGEYIITSMAGHHQCGVDLRAGLDLQYEAQKVFETQVAASYAEIPNTLKQYYYSAQQRLGVGEFDLGNYGRAEKILQESAEGLRENRFFDELIWSLNFLGQLYISMGVFDEAEKIIREAIAIDESSEEASSTYCYNLTLLGKLYLEWNRASDAREPLTKGFEESIRRQLKWELPLTRNYYIELLINPGFSGRNLTEAIRQAELNIEESRNSGFHRSLIAALSLRSIIALDQKQVDVALDFSTQSVNYLQKMGDLPALRTEEVLFNHYRVLMANDQPNEAGRYLDLAHQVLQRKAESITNPSYRKSYLERVILSQEIIKAIQPHLTNPPE